MSTHTTTARPYFDDIDGTDWREMAHTIEANGTAYRAVIIRDDYASAPDGDYGPIVLRRDPRRGWSIYGDLERVDIPAMGNADRTADSLISAWEEFDPETWERFAYIFHGASVHEFASTTDRGGSTYYAIVTADLWRAWGNEDDTPSDVARDAASEWQDWLDGDVYGIRVDRATGRDDDDEYIWETVEDSEMWGVYGTEYAEDEAYSAAMSVIDDDKRETLPLEWPSTIAID